MLKFKTSGQHATINQYLSRHCWVMAVLVLGAVAFWPGTSTAQVVAGTKHSGMARTVRLLDSHWVINKMPNFNRRKRTAVLNASQIAQLHCPWPAGVWQPVLLLMSGQPKGLGSPR